MLDTFKVQSRWEFKRVEGFDLLGQSMAISNQDLGQLGGGCLGNVVQYLVNPVSPLNV